MNVLCFLLVTLGCLLIYLSAKNQNILRSQLAKKPWSWLGWLCQVLALTGWLSTLDTVTAILAWLSFFMLMIGVIPFLPLYRLINQQAGK